MVTADATLNLEDFATALGVEPERLGLRTREAIAAGDFRYQPLASDEEQAILAQIAARLDSGVLTRAGSHRRANWQDAWAETLDRFRESNWALESLDPRFVDAGPVFRLRGRLVRALHPRFERSLFHVVRVWVVERFLEGLDPVFEFGSGSGFNLVALARVFDDRRYVGLDWSEAAVEIARRVGTECGLPVQGRRFDFFHPDPELSLPAGSAVMTVAALEQVGDRFEPFLDFLLDRAPAVVAHVEPVEEFYDSANPVDAMGLRYHRERGYLSGFLPRLRALADEGRIELLAARRMGFGNRYHEGYSILAWRPGIK